jgi:hypothetical protein
MPVKAGMKLRDVSHPIAYAVSKESYAASQAKISFPLTTDGDSEMIFSICFSGSLSLVGSSCVFRPSV